LWSVAPECGRNAPEDERVQFAISDDDQLILESLTAFAAEQLRPRLRAAEFDRALGADIVARFAEMGFEALDAPEAIGGGGQGMLTRVLVNKSLATADAGAALALDRLGPAIYVLDAFGGVEALTRFAGPALRKPGARIALIVEDFDRALAPGQRVVGATPWAPTDRADLLVGLGPAGAWVIEGGVTLEPLRGAALHAAGASRLVFDAPAAATWTSPEAAQRALARTRLYVASLLLGVLYDATTFSRAYATERVAFGQPIAHHQGLAFLIVDMFTAVEQCRLLVEDAARRIDAGESGAQHAAAAFVECVEASRFVGPNGVQILGGHGFMRDYPVEKAMRDSRALGLLAGGVHRARDDASALAEDVAASFEDV
jgi:alkylation response protein AidB-like acyl-CoA dehydrogenase